MTQLASHGMPANAGRKVGKASRKKTTHSVITSENRIPLQSIHVVNNSTADNEITPSLNHMVVFQVASHHLIH